jgi:GxxExxY protein
VGLEVHCEKRIQVRYDGAVVGDFFADMMIQNTVLIENKAVQALNKAHEVQLVNDLVATHIETGLLLNFGAQRLQFKRKSRVFRREEREWTGCTGWTG